MFPGDGWSTGSRTRPRIRRVTFDDPRRRTTASRTLVKSARLRTALEIRTPWLSVGCVDGLLEKSLELSSA